MSNCLCRREIEICRAMLTSAAPFNEPLPAWEVSLFANGCLGGSGSSGSTWVGLSAALERLRLDWRIGNTRLRDSCLTLLVVGGSEVLAVVGRETCCLFEEESDRSKTLPCESLRERTEGSKLGFWL